MASVTTSSPIVPSAAPWIFPSALNQSFISEFEAQWISKLDPGFIPNGTFKFGYGIHPDIISKAAWHLNDEERSDPSSNSSPSQREFGHEDVVVMVDDILQPMWSGGQEKIVGMACHYFHYCTSVSKPRVYQHNRYCISNNMYRDGLVTGTLSPMFWEMEHQFAYINMGAVADGPKPRKIPSGARVQIPRMNVSSFRSPDTAICMLTLDWDPSTSNSQHSVPFPVYLDARDNGRTTDPSNRIIHDPWVFNASFPRGISYDGARFGCRSGVLPAHYLISTGVCSRTNANATDAGHNRTRNGTWIHPDNGSNGTSNSTWGSSSPPGQDSKQDGAEEKMIAGVGVGSVLGIFIVAVAVWFLRRAKKRRQERHRQTLSANLQNDTSTFGGSGTVGSHGLDGYKAETCSLQIPPPTYAEAMRDNSTRG